MKFRIVWPNGVLSAKMDGQYLTAFCIARAFTERYRAEIRLLPIPEEDKSRLCDNFDMEIFIFRSPSFWETHKIRVQEPKRNTEYTEIY